CAFLVFAWPLGLGLTWMLFRRLARLELRLVASHPDRVGGLAFLELHATGFPLVILAMSSVVCAHGAHQILWHDAKFGQFQLLLGSSVGRLPVLFVLPPPAFSHSLWRTHLRGRFEYGGLAGRHVRGVHERWVQHLPVEDEGILAPPEIGPDAQ